MITQMSLFDFTNNTSTLTPRCWALYRLIRYNSLIEHRKTSQKEICEKLSEYGYIYNDRENVHDHCSQIWGDVKENNESLEHDKLIISKDFYYWLGNEEETQDYLNKLWNDIEARLTRYWKYYKKVKRNGQGKLLSNQLEPIDEDSKAERFFETFNDYNITKQRLNDKEERKNERN